MTATQEQQSDNVKCSYVHKEVCESRTRAARWVVGVLASIITVFLALVVYVSSQAALANEHYVEMQKIVLEQKDSMNKEVVSLSGRLDTHRTTQLTYEKTVTSKLDEIRNELSEQRKEQRVLLEKIVELQVAIAKKYTNDSKIGLDKSS